MSGSVSLINGHIDPDTNRMTPQESDEYFLTFDAVEDAGKLDWGDTE